MTGTAVTLALLASLAYGAGTALSRAAVRQHTASSVALWVQTVGFIAIALAAVAVRPAVSTVAVLLGIAAGALAACGVLAFYTAMQNGPISLVAPVAASGVAVPVAGGLLLGEQVSRPAFAGLALVIVGVMVISRSHGDTPASDPVSTGGGLDTLASPPGRSQVTPVHDNCKPSSFANPNRAAVLLAGASAAAFGLFYLVLREAATAAPSTSGGASGAGLSDRVHHSGRVGRPRRFAPSHTGDSLSSHDPVRSTQSTARHPRTDDRDAGCEWRSCPDVRGRRGSDSSRRSFGISRPDRRRDPGTGVLPRALNRQASRRPGSLCCRHRSGRSMKTRAVESLSARITPALLLGARVHP